MIDPHLPGHGPTLKTLCSSFGKLYRFGRESMEKDRSSWY
jgi:hypothetical protein